MYSATDEAACSTKLRSGDPSGFGGVPTARKITSACSTAWRTSVVNMSRPACVFFKTSCSRPGSHIDIDARDIDTKLGKTCSSDKPYVTGTNNGNMHLTHFLN